MKPQSKVLKWSLIIGIVIVLNMFFNYALSLIYKNPDFNMYCPVQQVNLNIDNQNACVAEGGQWNENIPQVPAPDTNTIFNFNKTPAGYCNIQFTCQNNFDAAQKNYDRNVFITLVILGAICVALANFFTGNMVIGVSFSLAGVLSFIIASMRYWGSANNMIKVIILAIALAILFWVAFKKFKNS